MKAADIAVSADDSFYDAIVPSAGRPLPLRKRGRMSLSAVGQILGEVDHVTGVVAS